MINQNNKNKIIASEIIRTKLIENNGKATIRALIGKEYEINITKDNEIFYCYDLPKSQCEYRIFDIIVEFLAVLLLVSTTVLAATEFEIITLAV